MVGYVSPKRVRSEPGWLGPIDELESLVSSYRVDRVIFADGTLSPDQRQALIYRCHVLDLSTDVVPSAAELFQGSSDALDDAVVPLIEVRPLYFSYVNWRTKRTFDLLLVVPVSIVALPLLLLAWGVVKITNIRENALVREWRPGLGAIPFPMWRLRTKWDGETTKVGALLVRARLDELPQLINVIRGSMSLVGPRPLSREEFSHLDVFQRVRYAVLPGITGLWQIARRRETSLIEMSKLDIIYCRLWSPLLDFTILLRSIAAVFAAPAKEWSPDVDAPASHPASP